MPEALPRSWNKGAARINVSVIVQEAEAEGSPLRRCGRLFACVNEDCRILCSKPIDFLS